MAKYIRFSRKGGDVVNITICPADRPLEDFSVVEAFRDQNRLRHALAVLDRTIFGGYPALPGAHDIRVTYDANRREFRLWTYTRNWQGRGSFLAGILVGKAGDWRKVRARRERRRRHAAKS